MRVRVLVALLFVGALTSTAVAATKVSGTATCKPDPSTPVDVTDKPNHALAVGRAQCTWTRFEVAGQPYKTGASTALVEITGDTSSSHGYHVATTASGDTASCEFQGSATLKDGKPESEHGTWTYTSGTGKLKGIKGKGTYKGTRAADGSMSYEVEGEYSLP